ncbi:uncharacterized protein AB675_1577 [Cyphellophora attinorum]|uniref:Uncharacterized protein n=1 Tax=Cyphellophora attinorum TaxID=1664694 RepID=A0A0N1H6X3_9EURO|nr:uncharacterized protein AB675_1577 [Phialophora attinorum]KPI37233.1 hypothetical protein AB675_1577 [Phialophora attinorum]
MDSLIIRNTVTLIVQQALQTTRMHALNSPSAQAFDRDAAEKAAAQAEAPIHVPMAAEFDPRVARKRQLRLERITKAKVVNNASNPLLKQNLRLAGDRAAADDAELLPLLKAEMEEIARRKRTLALGAELPMNKVRIEMYKRKAQGMPIVSGAVDVVNDVEGREVTRIMARNETQPLTPTLQQATRKKSKAARGVLVGAAMPGKRKALPMSAKIGEFVTPEDEHVYRPARVTNMDEESVDSADATYVGSTPEPVVVGASKSGKPVKTSSQPLSSTYRRAGRASTDDTLVNEPKRKRSGLEGHNKQARSPRGRKKVRSTRDRAVPVSTLFESEDSEDEVAMPVIDRQGSVDDNGRLGQTEISGNRGSSSAVPLRHNFDSDSEVDLILAEEYVATRARARARDSNATKPVTGVIKRTTGVSWADLAKSTTSSARVSIPSALVAQPGMTTFSDTFDAAGDGVEQGTGSTDSLEGIFPKRKGTKSVRKGINTTASMKEVHFGKEVRASRTPDVVEGQRRDSAVAWNGGIGDPIEGDDY